MQPDLPMYKTTELSEVYEIMKPVVSNKTLYVSIAAGITFKNLQENLGAEAKVYSCNA